MEAVIDSVLDWVESPRDYVMLCLVNRQTWKTRQNTLTAISAATKIGQCCDVETMRFSDDVLHGLRDVRRFYSRCDCLTLVLDPAQTEDDGQRCLTELWRHRLRYIVSLFCATSPRMRDWDSRIRLSCIQRPGTYFKSSLWEWIRDDDMVIFEDCFKLVIRYPRQVTDKGIRKLKSVTSLMIFCGNQIDGTGMVDLVEYHQLRYLMVWGFADELRITKNALDRLKHMQNKPTFDYIVV